MTEPRDRSAPDACPACPLAPDRRRFLQRAAAAAAGILLALGAAPEALLAEPIRSVVGRLLAAGVAYPIPAEDGAQIDRDNQVILVRWQGSVYAFNLSCPHQNTALRWEPGNARFQCPKHHSKYRPDGEFISGRATRGMDRLAIRREGAQVVVDVDTMFKEDADPAEWKAAVVTL